MTLHTIDSNRPSGSRRLTLTMLAARDQADSFQGVPRGTGKPFRYLAAFQEAEPYLGLPPQAYKLPCLAHQADHGAGLGRRLPADLLARRGPPGGVASAVRYAGQNPQ